MIRPSGRLRNTAAFQASVSGEWRTAAGGRLGDVAKDRFGAFHCEVIGVRRTAAIRKADRPQRVGGSPSASNQAASGCTGHEGTVGHIQKQSINGLERTGEPTFRLPSLLNQAPRLIILAGNLGCCCFRLPLWRKLWRHYFIKAKKPSAHTDIVTRQRARHQRCRKHRWRGAHQLRALAAAGVLYRAADRYSAWAEKAPTVSSTSPRAMPACLARFSHPSTAEATSSTICLPRSSVSP